MYHRRGEENLGQLELHHQELDSEDSLNKRGVKVRQHSEKDYSLIYVRDVARKPISHRSDRLSLDQIIPSVRNDGNFYFFKNYLFISLNSDRIENYVPCSIVFCFNFQNFNYYTLQSTV